VFLPGGKVSLLCMGRKGEKKLVNPVLMILLTVFFSL
jgi:hypothetical protein